MNPEAPVSLRSEHGLPGHLVGFVEALRARGIPGAPERMVQNTSTDANWTVCD
ncbi:type VII secretion protein EccB, partial [Mycobacterium tuberculosis]|nr:type VII secretion protein EccB [Mycobacterium tuberculosis]